jgi:hypothetical protein
MTPVRRRAGGTDMSKKGHGQKLQKYDTSDSEPEDWQEDNTENESQGNDTVESGLVTER